MSTNPSGNTLGSLVVQRIAGEISAHDVTASGVAHFGQVVRPRGCECNTPQPNGHQGGCVTVQGDAGVWRGVQEGMGGCRGCRRLWEDAGG